MVNVVMGGKLPGAGIFEILRVSDFPDILFGEVVIQVFPFLVLSEAWGKAMGETEANPA